MFRKLNLFVIGALLGAVVFTSPASAGDAPASGQVALSGARLEQKFEHDMRKAYAAATGVEMSIITRSFDSKCVRGYAELKDEVLGYAESFMLAYCTGFIQDSYYGDYLYENAYLNDYVVDQDWNVVYDFWTDVNIAGIDLGGKGIALQDAFFSISFDEVKKGYSRNRSYRSREDDSLGAYYRYTMRGQYVEAAVEGFEFYLTGEPKAFIERTNSKGADGCVETQPGKCGGPKG